MNKKLILLQQEIEQFEPSRFFHSVTAIENFFGRIEDALPELEDDQLTDLFTQINYLGNRAWYSRCLILNEIKTRQEQRIGRKLTEEELKNGMAKKIELATRTIYDDLQILKLLQENAVEPRLERTFYQLAQTATDFKIAIEHAEDEQDTYHGKYTTTEFKKWIKKQKKPTATGTDEKKFEDLKWPLPTFTVWNYGSYDPTFGKQIFGSIPPQIVGNLLYLYTKENDFVFDPFVGGGMTIEVCEHFNRKCFGSDLTPQSKKIVQHDITAGLPELPAIPKLIVLDPPYWKQAENRYSTKKTDLGNIELDKFYSTFDKLFSEMKSKYTGTTIALIIGITKDNDIWFDHPFEIRKIMDKYFTFKNRVIVPYSTQVHSGNYVKEAKEKKELLYLFRDLLIYEL